LNQHVKIYHLAVCRVRLWLLVYHLSPSGSVKWQHFPLPRDISC